MEASFIVKHLPYIPEMLLLGIYCLTPKKKKVSTRKFVNECSYSLIYNSQNPETTQILLNRGSNKKIIQYLGNRTPADNKKKWFTDQCNNIDESHKHYAKQKKSDANKS